MNPGSSKTQRKPLDAAALERLALHYVGRYATTRARLADYLVRKLRERGWNGASPPAVTDLVERITALGYVDDRAFAESRGAALSRRGYGARRVADALRVAGIAEEDASSARAAAAEGAWDSALAFARRKRIGPFAREPHPEPDRRKALQAFMRAGHPFEVARLIVSCAPGCIPDAPN